MKSIPLVWSFALVWSSPSLTTLLFPVSILGADLAYVKTDSPRDTMESFIRAMNDYRQGVLEEDPRKKSRLQDAIRCLAQHKPHVLSSKRDQELAAIFLKEVIDRVILIDFDLIPSRLEKNRWRLKNTEIVLKPQTSGEREGEWLITEDSWKRAYQFYQRLQDKPYLEGSGQGAAYVQPWMDTYLPGWSKKEALGLKNWQWLGLLLGLFIGFFLRLLVLLSFSLYKKLNGLKRRPWKKELIQKVEKPLSLLLVALFWSLWVFSLQLEGLPYSLINGAIQIAFGWVITWGAYLAVSVMATYFKSRAAQTESALDDQLVPFVEKILKLIVILLGVLLVLQNMGVNVFSLLAGLGLGGLAFALAAKDTAANLFGSIMILVDRPFKLGDWVVVGEVEGTIEEIGFRSTRIRTFYNSLVTLPNAHMADSHIDNLGARAYRRVKTHLDMTYDTSPEKMEAFTEGIRQIILDNPISRKENLHVYFTHYGASSLQILVYFFLVTKDWAEELREKQNIFMEIYKLADRLGVEFAYPTQSLYLNNQIKDNHREHSKTEPIL